VESSGCCFVENETEMGAQRSVGSTWVLPELLWLTVFKDLDEIQDLYEDDAEMESRE